MNWINLTFVVFSIYFIYYLINILFDLAKSKKVKTAGDNTIIQFEEDEEPTIVTNDFLDTENKPSTNEIEEEEEEQPVSVIPINTDIEEEEEEDSQEAEALVEAKKKESKEEENIQETESEEKDTQDVKFQSMPVSEFLANAKKFSSQIDF